jgi:acetyl-CoA carboxylase biotin carboxyl carrier protein
MSDMSTGPGSNDIFDVKKVRRLVELMKEHDLGEIDLRQGDQRVRIRRGAEPVVTGPAPAYYPPPAARPAGGEAAAAPSAPAAVDLPTIKSPMVGTFYVASGPDTPAFVKVGDHVGNDTIVCIIEAMKVFNEIPAEMSGKIAAVLVENGSPVEFGQPLFKIEPGK